MLTQIQKHKWFFLILILAVFLALYRFNHGVVQQDNYIGYAQYFPSNIPNVSFYDSRLLPGLSILIYLLHFVTKNYFAAGYLITMISFAGSYFVLYKLTRSSYSFLPLVFPPVLLNLATLIDTEYPFIFLTIFSYFLFKKNDFKWAFLLIGISVWFRLAGLSILTGIFIYMLLKKKIAKFFIYLPYFMIPVVLLFIYNIHNFGVKNPFYQLFTYEALHPGRINMGIVQLVQDLVRAYRWGWFRILSSGIFYIFFYFYLFIKSFNKKDVKFWLIAGIYLFTLTVNLVPFLENLGRYLAPTVPIFWLIYYKKIKGWLLVTLFSGISVLLVIL